MRKVWPFVVVLLVMGAVPVLARELLPSASGTSQMAAQAIVVCGGLVMLLGQLIKQAFPTITASRGVLIVTVLAAGAVALWAWDKGAGGRGQYWDLAITWAAVAMNASGLFKSARASTEDTARLVR